MKIRKDLALISVVAFAFLSVSVTALEIGGLNLPLIKKTAFNRTRGEPVRHETHKKLKGKLLRSKSLMKAIAMVINKTISFFIKNIM